MAGTEEAHGGAPLNELRELEELLAYLRKHEGQIFVLEQTAPGNWESIALSELSPELWAEHVARFIKEGRAPVRMKSSLVLIGIGHDARSASDS
jgi:hypothetical protein